MASRTYNYCFNPDDDDVECFLIQIDCMIKSLSIEDEDGKKRALIESLSTKALKQLLMHLHPVKWDAESTTLDIMKEGLRKMYTPQVNKWVAREYFNHRIQREDETVEDYAVALKDMANYCDFGTDYESRIMEKLSVGLRNAANKQAMFSFYGESMPNIDISLEKAIEKAIAIESATNITYMFNHQGYDGYDTGAVGIHSWSAVGSKAPSNWKCWRCGECDHAAESCWVKTQICPICREYGHIPQMCAVLQRSYEHGRREYSDDGQPMEKILDYIKISQRGRGGGGRGGPLPSSEHIDESILQFLQPPMQNQRQFQGRGRLQSLPHVQNANDMGFDTMRGPVGRGSMPHPAFGVGQQRHFPQNAPDYDESDIEYDQNYLSPNRGGRPLRGRGGSRFSPARVEEVQTEYLQATHPAGRSDRLQGNNQLSAGGGGGGGPVRGSVSQAQSLSVNSSQAASESVSQNAAFANQGPHAASAKPGSHAVSANQSNHAPSAHQAPHTASANEGPHAASTNQGLQATNSSKSLSQAQLAESISKSLNQAPPQFTEKSSKQFMPQVPEEHHTLPKQNKQMNNLLGELQNKHKNWRGSKSLSPSDYGDEIYEKDKFRSLPGRGKDNHRHSWGGSGLPKSGSMTSEGETDESIDQMYASLGNVDGRTNIVALDLHSPATGAVPTDAKVPNKALSISPSRSKPFKLPSSAFAPFQPIVPILPEPPTPPPRVRGNKHSKDVKGDKDSIVKACSKEEYEFVVDKEQSKEDSKSVENNKHSEEVSESIVNKETSKEDSKSTCIEPQSKSIDNNKVKMTAVTNSEEKKPSPKGRPDQPPLPARAPRITVPNMKSPEPNSEIPPSSPSTPPPPPPPPPSDYDCIASPTPPDLPPPPEICRSSSPPPPPPPPSYNPSEVSGDELPPPPIPTHQQEATLEFPPPPPSIVESKKYHTKASVASLPTPPTPPPRHSRNGTKTENNYNDFKEYEEESIDKPDLPPPPARVLRGIDAFFPDDALCNQVIPETDEEYEEEFLTDVTDTDDEVFHEAFDELPEKFRKSDIEVSDLCSLDSSSTLTATLLLTQASDVSPLPPHALRVSPVPTEEATNLSSPDCTNVTDDRTITPLSDFTPVSNLFDMSKDSTFDMETPAPTPQLSETPVTTGEYSPDLQKISSPSIEEFDSKAGSDISLPQSPSETLCSETISTLTPEMSDVDRRSLSQSSTNATRAQMSSPMSIDTPTLFSLPTDTSRISVDFDSLVDDTLTIDTSTFNTSSQNHFLASCSEFTDNTSHRSVDSALGSAPLSPAYTGSCTITPMPTDNTLTPMSTNPTTTPIPSPIPRELLYPTPPSSLPSEAFVSPWQSFSNSASIDTSSIQEDLTPTELNLETTNVQNVMQINKKDEKNINIISITETSVKIMDTKDISSSDQKSVSSLTEEIMQKESCSEEVTYVEDRNHLNDQGNEKDNIITSSLTSTTKSFDAEVSNGETEQIEKILEDVIETGTELTTSLSEVKNIKKSNDLNKQNSQDDMIACHVPPPPPPPMPTKGPLRSDNQTASSVESSPPITSPSLALLSVTSPEIKQSVKSRTRASLTSTSSVESTSSLTSISSLSNESNTVSSMDSMKLHRKEKAKPDVIVKELGGRNSLTDQIVRELVTRQKSEDRSNAQDTFKKSNKPPIPENIPSTPFTISTPPGSPATLRRRGRPNYLPRGSPEPHLEILNIPDPPTPPPRRNKLGSTKVTPETSKCDLSIASTTKVGGFIPRPPQRSNTLPIIPLNRNAMQGRLPTSSSISPLSSTLPVPIPGKHNKSPRSPIPVSGKPEKSPLSSSQSLRSLINKGGARMKSLSPLRNAKNISPARSSSPIRWVHSPIPSSPQSPTLAAAPKSPEQAINYLDTIMDSLDALTSNLPNSPPPESEKSGQVFFPQGPISSNKVKQDSSEDVEIPWRKKRSESGIDTNTDKSNKATVTNQGRPNSECLENLVNHILNDVDTNLEMQKTEVSSYQGHTGSKQTESLKTKSVEERNESFVKEYEQKVNFTYSNKNDVSFAVQSQQEKLDQIRQKKDSGVKEESRRTENSCDSTHKETRVTFTSNSQESRYDLQSGTNPSVTPQSVPLSELLSEPLEPSRVKNDIKSHENIPVSQKSTSVSHRNVIETHESNVQVSQCVSNALTENTSSSMTNTSVHSENISSPVNAASIASGNSASGSIRVTSGNGIAYPENGSASVKKNPVLLEDVTISQTNAQDSSMNISYESSFKSTFIAAKNCESETTCSSSESSTISHSLDNSNNLTASSSSYSSPSSTLSSSSSNSSSSSSTKTSEYQVSSFPHELNEAGMYEEYVSGEGERNDLFDKSDMLSPDEEKCVADDLDEEHQTSFNFLEHSASQTFKPYPLEHTESHSSISTILTASSCLSDSTVITVIQNTSDTDNDLTRDNTTANKIDNDNLNFEFFENNDNDNVTVSALTNVIIESDEICDAKDTFDANNDSDYMSFNNNNSDILSVSTNSLSIPNAENESNPVPLSTESNTLSDANIDNMGCLESSFLSSPTPCSIHDDATTTPPPVSHHSKTPPLPPPRSTTTTPKPLTGLGHVPAPPVRQYMLVPINHPLAVHSARSTPARQLSPPPAPLRSSSIRKTSPPPPPNRSRSQTPVGWLEWTEQRPPLPPPPPPPLPISACNSATPTPLKLTPVPEESDSRSPSDYSQSPQSPQSADEEIDENTVSEQTSKDFSNESSVFCGYVGKVNDIGVSKSSDNISSAEPPRIPPPPSDDVDHELPPFPPPPSDTTPDEEKPLPPPLPSDIASLSIQRIPTPPPRNKIVTPALPPLPNVPLNSSPLSPQHKPPQLPPPPLDDIQSPNNINNFLSAESEPGNSEASVMPSEPPPPTMLQANGTANSSSLLAMQNVCLFPPPPPPPMPAKRPLSESSSPTPPVLSISPYGRVVVNRTDLPPPSPEEEIRKVFKNAKDWAWLDQESDTLAVYTQLRPTMQQGPQCGLVALSMASQIFPETLEVDTILERAKDHGFTSPGEMFSAEKMAQLASEISGVEASVHRDVLSNPKILLQTLLQGDLILVPYDADGNHQPSKRKGHKAHWGVISGALVQCHGLPVKMGGAAKLDFQVDHLYHLRPKNRAGLPGSARRGGGGTTPVNSVSPGLSASPIDARLSASPLASWGTPDVELWKMCSNSRVSTPQLPSLPTEDYNMVVLWRQGKSRTLIASTLDALCESNDQLEEYTPPTNEIEHDAPEFLEPGSCCVISIQQK